MIFKNLDNLTVRCYNSTVQKCVCGVVFAIIRTIIPTKRISMIAISAVYRLMIKTSK